MGATRSPTTYEPLVRKSKFTLTYDNAGELTGDGATAHTYDLNGNRTDAGYVTGAANQTSKDGSWTYTYDTAGNRTKKSQGASAETWTFFYDHDQHLTKVEKRATDGGTLLSRVDFVYDALGNRVRRIEYDGSLTVIGDERYAMDGWKTGPGLHCIARGEKGAVRFLCSARPSSRGNAFSILLELAHAPLRTIPLQKMKVRRSEHRPKVIP
jgi:hypothetical protein